MTFWSLFEAGREGAGDGMPNDSVPQAIRGAAESVLGPTTAWTLLSTEHSEVWATDAGSGRWSVKHLRDSSSDSQVERWLLDQLDPTRVRRIHDIVDLDDGSQVIVCPYVAGELLATRLELDDLTLAQADAAATDLHHLLRQVREAPLRGKGFGRIGGGREPVAERWTDALRAYLEDQRRKGPRVSRLLFDPLWQTLTELGPRFDAEVRHPRLHPTDVNARNFLFRESDGRLVALNLPVVWQGDPAMPYGILQLHLDDTPMAAAVVRGEEWPAWRLHFYAMYHAYVICVYAERFSAVALAEVTPWGRHRTLLDLFAIHHGAMREAL